RPEQDEQYRAMGLKVMPKQEGRYFSSTIDFYTPTSYRDPKINRSYAAGTVMQIYGYEVPPGLRVWTDDYSNVLSVFRWEGIVLAPEGGELVGRGVRPWNWGGKECD